MTDVDPTQFSTTSLDTAYNTNIPNLVTDLTTLRNVIDTAHTNAVVGDLTFTPGNPGVAEETAGLNAYKAQLVSINTSINAIIDLLNNNINGNISLLISQINLVKNETTNTIVSILDLTNVGCSCNLPSPL